jgi:CRISPR-associated protein Cas2
MLHSERLNAYRIMWLLIMYDLPTDAQKFRKDIMKDGFDMFLFSKYIRYCASKENAEVHVDRIKRILPPFGTIGILRITDKQFGDMEVFTNRKTASKNPVIQQLELF